jgi:septal ring factor EnvC (AmiA/AmiB activator)
MRRFCIVVLVLVTFLTSISAQSKAELEEKRKRNLEEISYVDNLLKSTAREKNESMSAVKIIGKKLTLRESVILSMREEISLVSKRIELNSLALEMMEEDLNSLRKDYSRAVINSYKQKKGNPDLVYILSARDFNQGYKRLKYLQQITKFRRRETEIILELKGQIETSKAKLQADLYRISDLKSKEEQQKLLLQTEQERKKKMVKSLGNKEKQLKKELEEKKRIASKIEAEIARLIEAERRKAIKSESTPEMKLIGDSFAGNKGRLPWPVEKGIISSHFGVQTHPVLKYVTENNIGIEITSSGKSVARSVFQGEVASIIAINGANMTVMIRHGKYLSVYTNLVNVKVKKGDKINTKQELGDVFSDPVANKNCILKFMIFDTKYLDPELWISKN